MFCSDVGTAIVLKKLIQKSGDERSARLAFLIWLYFPLGIIISSVWGQLDPISLFLTLIAIYYLLTAKWLPSAISLGLATYLKTLPVVFLPVLLLQLPARTNRLKYSLVSLIVPAVGTLLPAWALNWGFRGLYNNTSFQVAIPTTGEMSLLGQVHVVPSLLAIVNPVTGIIWIPVMLATYLYIWKRNVQLVPALLLAILAFSISRPFLPEQWSLYPLAFLLLLIPEVNLEHFMGLTVAATGFVLVSNPLLVRFFTPIYAEAYNWDIYINNQSPYVLLRSSLLVIMALLYFIESTMIITGRRSAIYRVAAAVFSHSLLQNRKLLSWQASAT